MNELGAAPKLVKRVNLLNVSRALVADQRLTSGAPVNVKYAGNEFAIMHGRMDCKDVLNLALIDPKVREGSILDQVWNELRSHECVGSETDALSKEGRKPVGLRS